MKIAIVADNNKVSQHFGKAPGFFVYDGTNKTYYESIGHGAIPKQLKELGIDFVACGGIGEGAINNLKELNIKAFTGLEGFCDDIANGFFKQILVTGNSGCNSHDHSHHSNHSCNCKCGK
ncbi:MAG: NifB/NifX family molybdenum-iron cluster-binding protein [Cetobacterium sp.]